MNTTDIKKELQNQNKDELIENLAYLINEMSSREQYEFLGIKPDGIPARTTTRMSPTTGDTTINQAAELLLQGIMKQTKEEVKK